MGLSGNKAQERVQDKKLQIQVPLFSSGLPTSSAHAATPKSEFNVECFYKIFSDLAKKKNCQLLVKCEQNFVYAQMLQNGTPLSGYNQGGKIKKINLPCVIS